MIQETFAPYPVAPRYKAGTQGTILSPYGRVLTPYKDKAGYMRTRIVAPGPVSYLIHRIVAQTFIPNPDNLPDVNHIDHDKANNAVTNLEWVTRADNIAKARKHHGNWSLKGADSPLSMRLIALPVAGGDPVEWAGAGDAVRALGGNNGWRGNISRAIRSGKPAYGFYWSLAG